MMIESSSNPKVKLLAKLREKKKARESEGLFSVEGGREIIRALSCQWKPSFALYAPSMLSSEGKKSLAQLTASGAELYETKNDVLNKLLVRSDHDGVIAALQLRSYDFSHFKDHQDGLFLVAESLEKPGNLGAILRTADGAGADGVILTESSVDPFNPNVIRASLGTVFHTPIVKSSNEEAAAFLATRKTKAYVALPNAKQPYHGEDYLGPTAFVLGNESHGLSLFWAKDTNPISLPMLGIADSLNVSLTAGVLLYEARRQRTIPSA